MIDRTKWVKILQADLIQFGLPSVSAFMFDFYMDPNSITTPIASLGGIPQILIEDHDLLSGLSERRQVLFWGARLVDAWNVAQNVMTTTEFYHYALDKGHGVPHCYGSLGTNGRKIIRDAQYSLQTGVVQMPPSNEFPLGILDGTMSDVVIKVAKARMGTTKPEAPKQLTEEENIEIERRRQMAFFATSAHDYGNSSAQWDPDAKIKKE